VIRGSAKNAIAVIGMAYEGSERARATFCREPMGQMQPRRKKPKYAIENTESRKMPSRLRARIASHPERTRQEARTATSRSPSRGARGAGFCAVGAT
jgi:hypothetical protein